MKATSMQPGAATSKNEDAALSAYYNFEVAALRKAGAHQLSEVVLDADHSFSDKRIALANTITAWLAQLRARRLR